MEALCNISLCLTDILYDYERYATGFISRETFRIPRYKIFSLSYFIVLQPIFFVRRMFCCEAVDKTWKKKDGDFSGATFCKKLSSS